MLFGQHLSPRGGKIFGPPPPYLNFDGHNTAEFVNRALKLWKGLRILKFKLSSGCFDKSDVDLLVHLAKENGVQELCLEGINSLDNLYSCSSLKVLSLTNCKLGNGNVEWNQLTSLTIKSWFLDEHSINQVISGSPRLEVLILKEVSKFCGCDKNLSIRSSSLKRLSIHKTFYKKSRRAELRIWSPNLETLDFVGEPYGKYSLVNVSSLTHLTLDFYNYHGNDESFGETLGQLFPTIPHVEKLTLSGWCIKVLGAMKDKSLLSPLSSNLKFLTIDKFYYGKYKHLVEFLMISPNLKTLVIGSERCTYDDVQRNIPESFLLQLKRVEISLMKDDKSTLRLIDFLLKHASKLEKMVIRVGAIKGSRPSMSLCSALQKELLRKPRSSPTAELIVVDSGLRIL